MPMGENRTRLPSFLVAACVVLSTLRIVGGQAPPTDTSALGGEPVIVVQSVAELEPATEAERQFAAFYDSPGPALLASPVVRSDRGYPSEESLVTFFGDDARSRARMVCAGYDFVGIGSVTSYRTFLNRSATKLVSAIGIAVEERVGPGSGPDELVIGQLGGKVILDGRLHETPSRFPISTTTASLFFIRELPGYPGSYRAFHAYPFVAGRLSFSGLEGPRDEVLSQLRGIADACPGDRADTTDAGQ